MNFPIRKFNHDIENKWSTINKMIHFRKYVPYDSWHTPSQKKNESEKYKDKVRLTMNYSFFDRHARIQEKRMYKMHE